MKKSLHLEKDLSITIWAFVKSAICTLLIGGASQLSAQFSFPFAIPELQNGKQIIIQYKVVVNNTFNPLNTNTITEVVTASSDNFPPVSDTAFTAASFFDCADFNTRIYVDSAASGLNNGSSWVNAFTDLQYALAAVQLCPVDTILVAQGTYFPDTLGGSGINRDISFIIPDGVVILGGYEGILGDTTAPRNWNCNLTILSGDIDHNGDSTNNTFNVVKTMQYEDTIYFDGFVIEHGNAIPNNEEGGGWWDGSTLDSAYLMIRNTVFRYNYAVLGGGYYGEGKRDLYLSNSEFYENQVSQRGGGLYFLPVNLGFPNKFQNVQLMNLLVHHNQANVSGGAWSTSSPDDLKLDIYNMTATQNSPDAVLSNSEGVTRIYNSIFWNNGTNAFVLFAGINTVQNSIVQGGYIGLNNKDQDPLFLDPNSDFHLLSASPAIDMGTLTGAPTDDLDGNARPFNDSVDIGVYETSFFDCDLFPSGIIYVDSSATGGENGSSWANAYTDLQDALMAARLCEFIDTIKVAQGTYYPSGFDTLVIIDSCTDLPSDTIYFVSDRTISFDIPDSVVVLGGYGHGTDSLIRDWYCNKTILSGDIGIAEDSADNSFHVVTTFNVSNQTVVDGFYIVDGTADSTLYPYNLGGGWFNFGSAGLSASPFIRNCYFTENHAIHGGGMANESSDGVLFSHIVNCVFNNNTAAANGGAIYDTVSDGYCNFFMFNSIISGNTASNGGGIYNVRITGECAPRFINTVINGNSASTGGAMYNNDARPWVINGIVWNNSTAFFTSGSGVSNAMNSILQSGTTFNDMGNNKTDGTNPKFIYAPFATDAPTAAGNFHVLSPSLAIDMGNNMQNNYPTDLEGNDRIQNSIIDIGPYETAFFDCNIYTAGIIYVDSSATGANNGSSWANAYTNLQDGLRAVSLCGLVDTVKVAQGTYYPSFSDTLVIIDSCTALPTDTFYYNVDRTVSFNIPDSVVVLGGYGHGTDSLIRDWYCNKTILCGDIGIAEDSADNSFHVVTTFNVSNQTVVDGFYIVDGNADSTQYPYNLGGGWFNFGSTGLSASPFIRNCYFTENHAIHGGGMANESSDGVLFSHIVNCVFNNNTAAGNGGAIYDTVSDGYCNFFMFNSIISGNTASNGGGIYNVRITGECAPRFINTVINGNSASTGGAMYNNDARPWVINGIVWNNSTAFFTSGSGVSNAMNSILQSGTTYNDMGNNKPDGTDPKFIYAPLATDAPTASGNFHVLSSSLAIDMGNNMQNNYPTDLEGNDRIQNSIIDVGPYETGFFNCDFYSAGIIYVDSAATGSNNGSSWANAYTDLQDALLAVSLCNQVDTIKVAQGTYYPSQLDTVISIDVCTELPSDTFYIPLDRTVSFRIPDSIVVIGGYDGFPGDTLNRDLICNRTILCGDIDQNGDTLNNSYHVVVTIDVDSTTVVDGFWIQGGNATGAGVLGNGGGWYNEGTAIGGISTPLIKNTRFSGNVATNGGGMYNRGTSDGLSSPILINCIFSGNVAGLGGGMFNNGGDGNSSPRLINTTFASNLANSGGAMYNAGNIGISNPVLINCIAWDNSASSGPVFYNSYATPFISHSLFQGAGLASLIIGDVPHSVTDGGNNKYGLDPIFLFSAPASLTTAGDYHVVAGSPAVNMGDNTANSEPIDLDGAPRFYSTIDMGPYEFNGLDCNLFSAGVVYVDSAAAGANNGTSWANAFTDLNLALFTVSSCTAVDTIKVAQGTYYPSLSDTITNCEGTVTVFFVPSRAGSFNIPDSSVVLGGYEGVKGDTLAARDWVCNQTILCGDIGEQGDSTDNSYHVVVTTNIDTAIIDGFVISGGNADSTHPNSAGGGWYNKGSGSGNKSNPTIINCIISGNTAIEGGGMNNDGRDDGNSSPTLINCIISGNTATLYGGGIDNVGLYGVSNPTLINCIVSGNYAGMEGGGIDNYAEGGISSSTLINCVISGNYSAGTGGGFYNSADEGGISTSALVNCILWNNSAAISDSIISENFGSTTTITYSIIQSGNLDAGTDITSPTNKPQGTDPRFLSAPPASAAPTSGGNFHLLASSPAIDMGTLAGTLPFDLDLDPRPFNDSVDIGAYETRFFDCDLYLDGIVYVDSAATGLNNGSSWANAYNDLQLALMAKRLCEQVDTIKVAQGTYYPSAIDTIYELDPCTQLVVDTFILPFDRTISFNISDSVTVLGGYEGILGDTLAARDWVCNKTTLCGDIDRNGDSVNNSYHVVVTRNVSDQTIVDGFCISGGNATENAGEGGGWYNDGSNGGNSTPVIRNSIIQMNAAYYGGGIFNDGTDGHSSPTIINSIIRGNHATSDGGGMYNDGENFNAQFTPQSNPVLINTLITGNTADFSGGGIYNEALSGEAGPVIINSVIAGNYAGSAGAIFTHASQVPTILWNSIVWNNGSADNSIIDGTGAGYNASYSIIQPDAIAAVNDLLGNKTVDPLFLNSPAALSAPTVSGDFHVLANSLAIDMGTIAMAPADDLDGNTRPYHDSIDIGAYEFIGPDCISFLSNVIYVDSSAIGLADGNSWATAFKDLQDALVAARFCDQVDTIKVAQGTYFPSETDTVDVCGILSIIPPSRADFFFIPDSTVVLGGYPAGGELNGPRDPHCNITILSGDINHDGDSTGNSYNVVKTRNYSDTIVFDGFIIEHGNAIAANEDGGGWWDGSLEDSAKLIIRNTTFRFNYALSGAGFYGQGNRDLMMSNSEFHNNLALIHGGGAYVGPVAVDGDTSFIRFENVLWHHNEVTDPMGQGGGLAGIVGAITNEVIDIVNNTFTLNTPDAYANNSAGLVNIYNSIFWNTGMPPIGGTNVPGIFNSIVEGIVETMGNKNQNPLFQSTTSNFHLSQGSPAIDMGENSYSQESTDLDGLPRIVGGIIDMGVYENMLLCFTDTIYVNEDGGVPQDIFDSVLRADLPAGFELLVNGSDSTGFNVDCDDLGSSLILVELVRSCNQALIDSCSLNLTLIDTFPKSLICNDLVNISLGNRCIHIVIPEDVLENVSGCTTSFYDVELIYPFGTHKFPPANDLLDESHIGYTMVYNVFETSTGNSCWGYLKVEDKMPPLLNCADDTIACYELPTLPLIASNEDDCYEGKVELISDEWFDYGCDSVLSGYVIRTIQGTDRWGNFRRCESRISIERTVIDSLECPDMVVLPCEIRTQIGGGKTLKTPITVDQSKVTPAYLLSLQKKTWEFTDNTKDWILNPSVQVVPQIKGQNLWPGAGGICKINSLFRDSRLDICGSGFKIHREWTIVDWCTLEERTCIQYITVRDTIPPVILDDLANLEYNASAHDCSASVTIPALVAGKDFRDCNLVDQTYILQYDDPGHPGKIVVLTGNLPSNKLNLPVGEYKVRIFLVDKCHNQTVTGRTIEVYDITPPTPVCDEITQVTVDPVTCWAKVKAKDLDNGSRDNCCDVLHFAAAHMDSITYWRKYWTDTLEARCGKAAFWADKEFYDFQIERWINAYVFKDEIKFDECGTSQVVLRVYEACGVPVYDPHLWPCTEHQWFWYNTDQRFRIEHNWNFFHKDGPKDCNYRYRIQCIEDHQKRLRGLCEFVETTPKPGGFCYAQYVGAVEDLYFGCESDFYFPQANNSEASAPGNRCSNRLYSDCMINVLVDDKQAPVVAELEDVLVYCDRAPDYASRPQCEGGDEYLVWPGLLKDSKGVEHGYYGGSDFLGIHRDEHETADACGYDNVHHWAPIYCRSWLYVDSFDATGQIDPKQYFETLVLFDKTRPARTLLAKEFSITDNCRLNDTTLKVTDEGSLNGCGEGWIQRTWTIRDKCDNPITVRQKVVVKHRSDFEVIFPEDKVVECDFLNTTDPKDAGEPIISDAGADECEQVGVQYKDEIFTVEDSACYKIVRTWTLIDWCIYNPNADRHYSDVIVDDRLRADTGNRSCVYRHLKDNNDGYMKYIQVIKVIDKVAPVVTTRDTTICIYGEDCKSTLVRIPFSGTDNCTAISELSYRVEVDLNATDGVFTNRTYVKNSIDLSTQSNPTEFVYSPAVAGKHVVHVIVKDNCGNEDTSSYRFELKDCKKPTPYCYNGIATVIMPSTGKITVWAKDLDAGSFDNCTLADKLKFSFSSNSTESSKEFSCTDIPDGKSKTIPVEIWVTDEAGNQDHCITYILLQDNSGNACPDVAGLSVTIAGTIQTETKEPVEHVRVNIYGGAVQMNYQTGVKGTYQFEGLPSKSNYSLKSTRDDQPMNGISTLDLVLIQKHILGIELLDSPYKVLAADIDNDKQITAIDLVELRKLILATYEDLPNNESWRFMPKSTTFADPQNPWNAGSVSEVMEMKEVATDYKAGDFIGIKIGDVNASVTPHTLMGVEVRGNETGLIFEITDQNFKRGDLIRVDFRSPNFRGISGWQGTLLATSSELRAASSLNLIELIPGKLNLSNQNLGLRLAQEGMITMSWNSNAKAGLDIDDQQVLFTLIFKAQENGRLSEVLRIGSQHTIAESYEGKGELGNLSIRFVQNGNEIVAKSALYQNYPNPFDQRTVIGINLANQGRGTLKVYDATGRTIKSVERDWTKGYHEVWFDRKEIGATGALYYRFESGFFNASKKMIIVD